MKVETLAFANCESLTSVTFGVGFEYNRLESNIFAYREPLVSPQWKRIFYWDIDLTNEENRSTLLSWGFVLYNGDGQLEDIHPLSEKSITITFDDNNGNNSDKQTLLAGQTIDESKHKPVRDGYDFAGWYVDKACTKKFDFTKPLINDMTLYAKWLLRSTPIGPATRLYPITIDYGTAYDADHNAIAKAAKGETVYIEADETAFDGMVFEYWKDHEGNVTLENDHAAKTSFTMPEGEVHLEAMYKTENDDSSWDAATVMTGVAIGTGTAILAYHIGTELYAEQVLGKGVAVPRTRAEVALLAWQLAGSPAVELNGEPLSETAQAERWAVESGLMRLDAEGNFNGAKKMSKLKALRVLEKVQKMN